jgi:hypothetical protein
MGPRLVPMRSATGKSLLKANPLPFLPKHYKIFRDFSHNQVAREVKIYRQIRKWCL